MDHRAVAPLIFTASDEKQFYIQFIELAIATVFSFVRLSFSN